MRCPSEFQAAYRAVAAKHQRIDPVDAPTSLEALSPTRLLDDHVFHDGQHPTFLAYLALAKDAIAQIAQRGSSSGSIAATPPRSTRTRSRPPSAWTASRWAEVCRRSASFWGRLSVPRYDGSERGERAARLIRAAEAIEDGASPEETGVPGLGTRPDRFRRSSLPAGSLRSASP